MFKDVANFNDKITANKLIKIALHLGNTRCNCDKYNFIFKDKSDEVKRPKIGTRTFFKDGKIINKTAEDYQAVAHFSSRGRMGGIYQVTIAL